MRFDNLLNLTQNLPYFDLPLLAQLSQEPKRQLTIQLHQWTLKKKILSLRRGVYALAEAYRHTPLSPLFLAGEIYKPSYLSELWALSYYGLIPEKVTAFTSATTRVTRKFENDFGIFSYSTLKKDYFWGFVSKNIDGNSIWMATPEKALLDYWYLKSGDWTPDRLAEMRFQNSEQLSWDLLLANAKKWDSPRLLRTAQIYKEMSLSTQKEYREL